MENFVDNFTTAIVNFGIAAFFVMAILYALYMIGLIFVLIRLHRLSWMAFVPILNFYAQVRAINGPPRWFLLALLPVVGYVYAGSVAIRLGAIFSRGPAFSLVWLTIGAPVGMFIIAFSKKPIITSILESEPRLLDVKAIKRSAQYLSPDAPLPELEDTATKK